MTIQPTLPGYTPGIIGTDPWTLQCMECGATETPDSPVTMTFRFNGHDGIRRCRDCARTLDCQCFSCQWELR